MAAKSSWFSIQKFKKLLGTPADTDIATDIANINAEQTAASDGGTINQASAMGTGTPNIVGATTSASANTFGSWAELEDSAGSDIWLAAVSILPLKTGLTGTPNCCIEIGTGAGASEVAKVRFSFALEDMSDVGFNFPIIYILPVPIKVASGVRIAARSSDSIANANQYQIGLSWYVGI